MKSKVTLFALFFCFISITHLNAESIYDLKGKWDALYESWGTGSTKSTIQITQTGNQFVGVKLDDSKWMSKGDKVIKGEISNYMLDKVFMVQMKNYPASRELSWNEGRGVITDMGNKMVIQQFVETSSFNFITTVTLTRKE